MMHGYNVHSPISHLEISIHCFAKNKQNDIGQLWNRVYKKSGMGSKSAPVWMVIVLFLARIIENFRAFKFSNS